MAIPVIAFLSDFAEILNNTTVDDQEWTVHLPEEETDAFDLFVFWLYRKMLPDAQYINLDSTFQSYLNNQIQFYGLAKKLKLVDL